MSERSAEQDAGALHLIRPFPNLHGGEDPRPVRCSGNWCGGANACPPCPVPPAKTTGEADV